MLDKSKLQLLPSKEDPRVKRWQEVEIGGIGHLVEKHEQVQDRMKLVKEMIDKIADGGTENIHGHEVTRKDDEYKIGDQTYSKFGAIKFIAIAPSIPKPIVEAKPLVEEKKPVTKPEAESFPSRGHYVSGHEEGDDDIEYVRRPEEHRKTPQGSYQERAIAAALEESKKLVPFWPLAEADVKQLLAKEGTHHIGKYTIVVYNKQNKYVPDAAGVRVTDEHGKVVMDERHNFRPDLSDKYAYDITLALARNRVGGEFEVPTKPTESEKPHGVRVYPGPGKYVQFKEHGPEYYIKGYEGRGVHRGLILVDTKGREQVIPENTPLITVDKAEVPTKPVVESIEDSYKTSVKDTTPFHIWKHNVELFAIKYGANADIVDELTNEKTASGDSRASLWWNNGENVVDAAKMLKDMAIGREKSDKAEREVVLMHAMIKPTIELEKPTKVKVTTFSKDKESKGYRPTASELKTKIVSAKNGETKSLVIEDKEKDKSNTITYTAEERWDSAKLGKRVELIKLGGWVTAQGQLTQQGEKFAERRWSELSLAIRNILVRLISKDYLGLIEKEETKPEVSETEEKKPIESKKIESEIKTDRKSALIEKFNDLHDKYRNKRGKRSIEDTKDHIRIVNELKEHGINIPEDTKLGQHNGLKIAENVDDYDAAGKLAVAHGGKFGSELEEKSKPEEDEDEGSYVDDYASKRKQAQMEQFNVANVSLPVFDKPETNKVKVSTAKGTKEVEAESKGAWAVVPGEGKEHHVIHAPSGLHMASFKDKDSAHQALNSFLGEAPEHHTFLQDKEIEDATDEDIEKLQSHAKRLEELGKELGKEIPESIDLPDLISKAEILFSRDYNNEKPALHNELQSIAKPMYDQYKDNPDKNIKLYLNQFMDGINRAKNASVNSIDHASAMRVVITGLKGLKELGSKPETKDLGTMNVMHHEKGSLEVPVSKSEGSWAVAEHSGKHHIVHKPNQLHMASYDTEEQAHSALDKYLKDNPEHKTFGEAKVTSPEEEDKELNTLGEISKKLKEETNPLKELAWPRYDE